MSATNNFCWRTRRMVPLAYCEKSFTYYDVDYNVVSRNNEVAKPVPKYNHNPGGNNGVLENLIWLISSNKAQAILILHQYQQGK